MQDQKNHLREAERYFVVVLEILRRMTMSGNKQATKSLSCACRRSWLVFAFGCLSTTVL
jgi:hypothetical protein